MRSYTRVRPALSALAAGTLVLGGPLVAPLAAQGTAVAGTPAGVESSIAYSMGVPEGRRPGHEGIKARMFGAFFGDWITVDVNPTLPGSKSYKVKLQVKRGGKWETCAVKRTENVRDTYPFDWAVRGRKPHEMTMFHVGSSCPGKVKEVSRYRIVLKAQHGYERTVSRVRLP